MYLERYKSNAREVFIWLEKVSGPLNAETAPLRSTLRLELDDDMINASKVEMNYECIYGFRRTILRPTSKLEDFWVLSVPALYQIHSLVVKSGFTSPASFFIVILPSVEFLDKRPTIHPFCWVLSVMLSLIIYVVGRKLSLKRTGISIPFRATSQFSARSVRPYLLSTEMFGAFRHRRRKLVNLRMRPSLNVWPDLHYLLLRDQFYLWNR